MIGLRIGLALLVAGGLFCQQTDQQAENDMRIGIALTREGRFQQAVPHFLSARGRIPETFALEFNLALCYVGTHEYRQAVQILTHLGGARPSAEVDNLLAQALIGDRQPESAALHFQRGLFRSQMEERDLANRDFELAQRFSPGSDIAYIAAAQQAFLSGDVQKVIRTAREGISRGHTHCLLLTMLGEALLRAGATPATPDEFGEAQGALERAVAERPGYSSAHIALGRIYLARQRMEEAVAQLESARQLDPRNRAVYSALATAYRRSGQAEKAREALAALAELNRQEAARIGSASGGHAGYAGGRSGPSR